MKGPGWRITDTTLEGGKQYHEVDEQKFPILFRLLDDDGNVYFNGRMTRQLMEKGDGDMLFAPLDEVGIDYGCTELQYMKEGSWATL